ncbi:MAG: SLBB domain-containing protein [Candidatus Binatia bacterium]
MAARVLMRGLSAFLLALLALPALAQVPTAEQLEMLRNLTPEQRQMLLEQLGVGAEVANNSDRERKVTDGASPPSPGKSTSLGEAELAEQLTRAQALRGDDTVIVSVGFPEPRVEPSMQEGQPPLVIDPTKDWDPLVKERLTKTIERLKERNPYKLDRVGAILMPGFAPIPLAGLSEEQAALRLTAEPSLNRLVIKVTRLPLEKLGPAGLKPFGYDLFKDSPSTFAPVANVPVPAEYIVGSGDELEVILYGNQNRTLRLTVGRDGRVNFPELGPISVAGQRFSAVQASLEERVSTQMIGVRASVSMGDIRAVSVFVLGEANRPGSYTVSGLATMTSAIYAAGGVKPIGSLRDVQLKRRGTVVRHLDLYDLLIRGDTSDDAKLLPGDVIFIPPVGPTVAVDGEVHRPAIYELRGAASASEVVALAGGLMPQADPRTAYLSRIDEQKRRVVVDVDLTSSEGRAGALRNGDVLRVARLRPTLDSGVTISGHVYQPGAVAYHSGLRLSDTIRSLDDLQPNADTHYVLIRRELPPGQRIAVLSADLAAALRAPGSEADVLLMPRDQLTVFDLESGRDGVIVPLLRDLKLQSSATQPTESVRVDGAVKVKGEYPLEQNMRVADLVRAGGGLDDAAFATSAELTRFRVIGDERQTETIEIDLAAALEGDPAANLPLQSFDVLLVKETPEWREQETVRIDGEVRFPGEYPIRRGESLRSVLERAGGLTSLASARAAIFIRESLREREQLQMDRLADRLQTDLATAALQSANANQVGAGTALTVGQSLLAQLRSAKAVGRLVIDLPAAVAAVPGSESDINLRDGDRLVIPKARQEVTVMGEVQNSTSHFYRSGLTRNDYIELSGGVTRKADDGQIYVVRADGSVVATASNRWFSRGSQVKMEAGDTVVVPLDTERLPPLPLWQAVTQILYNVAISVAAINSF